MVVDAALPQRASCSPMKPMCAMQSAADEPTRVGGYFGTKLALCLGAMSTAASGGPPTTLPSIPGNSAIEADDNVPESIENSSPAGRSRRS